MRSLLPPLGLPRPEGPLSGCLRPLSQREYHVYHEMRIDSASVSVMMMLFGPADTDEVRTARGFVRSYEKAVVMLLPHCSFEY